jgi:enoyl-CoA hydratase/carnithine racemase
MQFKTIKWEIHPNPHKPEEMSIGVITLNRPEALNAIDVRMRIELDILLNQITHNSELKVVVLTGAGKGFSAGGDLKSEGGPIGVYGEEWEEMGITGGYKEMIHYFFNDLRHQIINRLFRKLEDLKPVTIAAINGAAVGVGLEMATGCDIRVASDRARLGEVAVPVGFLPESGGARNLPKLVGIGKAIEMIMLGTIVSAEEALELGLVEHIYPHEKLMEETMKLAGKIAKNPYLSLIHSKKLVKMYWDFNRSEAGSRAELDAVMELTRTNDCVEGSRSWLEKREPNYRGPYYDAWVGGRRDR